MKRLLSLLLVLCLMAGLTACTAEDQAPEATATAPPGVASDPITSVDALLAALRPGATIVLGAGEFHLDTASDYGKSDSPFYTWNDLGLGNYELVLQGLDGVTIQGSGQGKTTLVTSPRSANVLNLRNCTNMTLSGMTLGHTEQAEACEGGVLRLESSQNIQIDDLGLFGCGSLGILSYRCQNLSVRSCDIYECSIGGVQLSETSNASFTDTAFYTLGGELPAVHVFDIYGGENISISQCMISGNYVQCFAYVSYTGGVTFRENRFISNRISNAAFSFQEEGVILENNIFDENSIRNWYAPGSVPASGPDNQVISSGAPEESKPVTPGVSQSVSTGKQKTVKVRNADEFLAAIAPNTCILLETELLDLSTAKSYQRSKEAFAETSGVEIYRDPDAPYYYWFNCYDGPGLVISGVDNFSIQAKGKDRTAHTISAAPRYADVLTFENCSAITLSGFTAGHTKEPGTCTGGVFLFRNSHSILVENCGMYGCGTDGFSGESCRDIQIVSSEIYECSYCGIDLASCENVAISATLIRDIGEDNFGSFFWFYSCKNVTLDGEPLDGNYCGN